MVIDVPRMSEEAISDGRRLGPNTTRAGRSARAHDEKRVRSMWAVVLPVDASGTTLSVKGTSSAL